VQSLLLDEGTGAITALGGGEGTRAITALGRGRMRNHCFWARVQV